MVAVLGDLGRSPRMQFQALALAKNGWKVSLLGYRGEKLLDSVSAHQNINVVYMSPVALTYLPYFLAGPLRLLILAGKFSWALFFRVRGWQTILIQSPPALPTMPVVWLSTKLLSVNSRRLWVIDWHNLGFMRFAERVGEHSFMQRTYRALEFWFGKRANGHLVVSESMKRYLTEATGIENIHVVYDRPLEEQINSFADQSKEELVRRIAPEFHGGQGKYAVAVSSTSWSDDEDPEILLNVGKRLDGMWESSSFIYDRLLIIITGKGPNKELFEKMIRDENLSKVTFMTSWLSTEDYRALLALSDFGVCLHTSASGIDLPMKLADMLGANLKVACFNYGPTLQERFVEGQNGQYFTSEDSLFELIHDFVSRNDSKLRGINFPNGTDQTESWESGWKREALPLFNSL